MIVGIIGAMDVEIADVKEAMEIHAEKEIAGMRFAEGQIASINAVLVKCGVGKVNAALCVQILADHFKVTHVVNIGVAGALLDSLRVGDTIISHAALYHDVDLSDLGYQKGLFPEIPAIFWSDVHLMNLAAEAIQGVYLAGIIASGDRFVGSREEKQKIREMTNADCCEMEGGGIAHACFLNQIPFVIIRTISDDSSGCNGYSISEKEVAHIPAEAVIRMMEGMNGTRAVTKTE